MSFGLPNIKKRKAEQIQKATGNDVIGSSSTEPDPSSVTNIESMQGGPTPSGASSVRAAPSVDTPSEEDAARSGSVISSMIGDENPWVRKLLALNSAMDEEARAELAEDENRAVREAVATATEDPELLAAMIDDPAPTVRRAVAANPNTPDRTRESLSRDGAHQVRAAAAERMTCPDRLSRLARDRDPRVRMVAGTNHRIRLADERLLADDSDPRVAKALATRSSLNEETLRALSNNAETEVRERVAAHPEAPRSILRAMIEDPAPQVRHRVATSTREAELLSELASDSDIRVQEGVVGNPNAPTEIKEIVVQGMNRDARARVARRSADPAVLAMLAEDESLVVRHEVAGNPRATQGVLAIIAEDEDEVLSARGAYRLHGDDRLERKSLMGPAAQDALEAEDAEEAWAAGE